MFWIQFNSAMFKLTGQPLYVQEVERSVYNTLLGARFPNELDWSYHTFTNGVFHPANFNDCCPSSGALALEELPPLLYTIAAGGFACNLYSESSASLCISGIGQVGIIQHTDYNFDGQVKILIQPGHKAFFRVLLRIPEWAEGATVKVNGRIRDDVLVSRGNTSL